jgi:hypothetical protein
MEKSKNQAIKYDDFVNLFKQKILDLGNKIK